MCNNHDPNHRHSIHCILSPHILRSIVKNGSAEQRQKAITTLANDSTFRALRNFTNATLAGTGPVTMISPGKKQRTIIDAKNLQSTEGKIVRFEGDPATNDPAVDEAYDGLGVTYDFFWNIFERHSIDDEGMPLQGIVHFGKEYNNAFWDGQKMTFGDGDDDLFKRFTISLDVIGHELAHGVTEDEAGLVYFNQAGALNESMSDVFGSMVKQYKLNQSSDKADWLIGAELLSDKINGKALRSMSDPGSAYDDPVLGKDPQPKHMDAFVNTFEDNGGVHINSGIPNRAFYLAATNIGGFAWERAGKIWYETLKDARLRANTGFKRFANLTVYNAVRLFGQGSLEEQAVQNAWNEVGIKTSVKEPLQYAH